MGLVISVVTLSEGDLGTLSKINLIETLEITLETKSSMVITFLALISSCNLDEMLVHRSVK